ncbi:transposase [Mesorhizobium sp. M0848]|uniref:transposase n=1 Tax=Mesorhizobium sp. M0848 TaxID=2957012 RepID=UPI0033380283
MSSPARLVPRAAPGGLCGWATALLRHTRRARSDPCLHGRDPAARRKNWIVYAKPFGSPEQVLAYLGRYTPRSPSPTVACQRRRVQRNLPPARLSSRQRAQLMSFQAK